MVIVDGENIDDDQLKQFAAVMKSAKKSGRTILIMTATKGLDSKILPLLPANIETTNRTATAFNPGERSEWGGYFTVPALYFSEIDSKEPILKQELLSMRELSFSMPRESIGLSLIGLRRIGNVHK